MRGPSADPLNPPDKNGKNKTKYKLIRGFKSTIKYPGFGLKLNDAFLLSFG